MGGLAQNVQKPPLGKNVQKSQGQIFQECVECQECQGQISQGQIFQECVECQECQGQISQGQIFQEFVECQECQGQMPRSNISGMPRSNAKVKYFRNAKVKCQGQMSRSNFPRSNGKPEKTGKKRKKPEKWESVTKIKKP